MAYSEDLVIILIILLSNKLVIILIIMLCNKLKNIK